MTSIFGGEPKAPEGGNPDSNTLLSDTTTVICLDDYHCLDRFGRKEEGVTALARGPGLRPDVQPGEGPEGGQGRGQAYLQPRLGPVGPRRGDRVPGDPHHRGPAPLLRRARARPARQP